MGAILDAFKEMDRKTLLLIVGGLGGLILLILILSLLGKANTESYGSYQEAEKKLVVAAQKYYADNTNYLPINERETSTVSLNTLVEGEYIKPLNKYLKDGDSCDAEVVVTKTVTDYEYMTYLDCGENYSSVELYKKVLEDNAIVDKGVGLYNIDGEKVFRGEVKNNYILLNKNYWRILRIDSDNNLVLMSEFSTDSIEWDDRYNIETDSDDGINNYNMSRVKDYIEEQYYGDELLTNSEKTKVVYKRACIGSRGSTTAGNMNTVECSELSDDELPIRLITVGEYLITSIDPNCNTIEDRGCTNYNFMHDKPQSFWTITKGQKDSSCVYGVNTSGIFESTADNSRQLRYIILLSSKTIYASGSGLYDDPYVIK